MDFEAGVGQVDLAGGEHERIGGAVEGAQAEVVAQVAVVVHGEALTFSTNPTAGRCRPFAATGRIADR